MRRTLSIPLLLFAALLLWTMLTPRDMPLIPTPPAAPAAAPVPDSYSREVTAAEYGEDGELIAQTRADELRYFRGAARVDMDAPRRASFGADGNWVASADAGTLLERREALRLDGDVRLSYTDEGAEFRTAAMLINMRTNVARSLAPVEAWEGDNRLRAEQLVINLDREVAILRGDVRSTYVPTR